MVGYFGASLLEKVSHPAMVLPGELGAEVIDREAMSARLPRREVLVGRQASEALGVRVDPAPDMVGVECPSWFAGNGGRQEEIVAGAHPEVTPLRWTGNSLAWEPSGELHKHL